MPAAKALPRLFCKGPYRVLTEGTLAHLAKSNISVRRTHDYRGETDENGLYLLAGDGDDDSRFGYW